MDDYVEEKLRLAAVINNICYWILAIIVFVWVLAAEFKETGIVALFLAILLGGCILLTGYDLLLTEHPYDEETLEGYVELMVEICCSRRDFIRIAGDEVATGVVKSRFLKLKKGEERPAPYRYRR